MHAGELVGVHVPQSDDAVEPAVGMTLGGLCPALFTAAVALDLFGQFPVCTRAVGLSQRIRLQCGINASADRLHQRGSRLGGKRLQLVRVHCFGSSFTSIHTDNRENVSRFLLPNLIRYAETSSPCYRMN